MRTNLSNKIISSQSIKSKKKIAHKNAFDIE